MYTYNYVYIYIYIYIYIGEPAQAGLQPRRLQYRRRRGGVEALHWGLSLYAILYYTILYYTIL